jgi:glycosyltransferase involved in cell wall biosynthesis
MIVIGIPVYNEQSSLPRLMWELCKTRENLSKKDDLVFVAVDGSTDTSQIILRSEFDGLIIRHSYNRGIGDAIKSIFAYAIDINASHVVLFPGNGRVNP